MLAFSLFGKAMTKPEKSEKEVFKMYAGPAETKWIFCSKIMIAIIACFIWLSSVGACSQLERLSSQVMANHSQTIEPLLLNSGVVQKKEAEVNVILWFEDGKIPPDVWTNKPTPNWIWNYKVLKTESGKVAVTLAGHCQMNKNEESNLYTWYTIMAQQLSGTGGRIYLDERVPQLIDISAYLSQTSAIPSQWALIGNMLSIAAYQNNLKTSVMAGNDRINIQLLSRGKNTVGQTVLAIPVLLDEF
ncbi:conserved hypothetical protein [Candidatus Desulfosporosinus infrequens]|uniref:Uncharacterized protein n=1 Tax=Candidatus Desulfosporosinus infrequens TaxID=2043169 RepID=A0A2U3LVU4_9FIRM|nr:conserved hypothetical protein [Candidatus Desulfosporosinus infrequens]